MRRDRFLLLAAVYAALLAGGWLAGEWLVERLDADVRPSNEPTIHRLVMTSMMVFVLASSIPFIPGAEIGFGMLLLFGGNIALLVYVGMVGALVLAFVVGRHVPIRAVAVFFNWCGLAKAHDLAVRLSGLSKNERLTLLTASAPRRIVPFLLRYRHLCLVALLNLPGNSVIGGGGGIAFIAGVSGLYSYPGFLAAVCVAVAPVPMMFALAP